MITNDFGPYDHFIDLEGPIEVPSLMDIQATKTIKYILAPHLIVGEWGDNIIAIDDYDQIRICPKSQVMLIQ